MKYYGYCEGRDNLITEFEPENVEEFPTEEEILFACLECESYDGYAVILFKRDNQLYMVEGSDSSFYGFEGQWKPDAVEPEQILLYGLNFIEDKEANLAWKELGKSLNNLQ